MTTTDIAAPGNVRRLWLRWVVANAVGECVGLGLTFVAIGLLTTALGVEGDVAAALLAFAIAIASGAIEATIVGLGQWWAMHPWLQAISRGAWWRGTLIGALVAYGLGYLPSTLMSMGEPTSGAAMVEPPQAVVLLLAGCLGLVAGAVLAFAQWLVLRRYVARAGRWLPANMLAWAAGMPLIFEAMDIAFRMPTLAGSALVVAAGLLVAGAVVGAIHGAFLAGMASRSLRA